MTQSICIYQADSDWSARVGNRRDPDLQDAVRAALDRISVSSAKRIRGMVEAYLNFRQGSDDTLDSLIYENRDAGLRRLEAFLEAHGFACSLSTREDEATLVERGTGTNFDILSCFITALDVMYQCWAKLGLRDRARPTKIYRWQDMGPGELADLKRAIYGSTERARSYKGSQFVAVGGKSRPLRFEDPRGLGKRMLAAAVADSWKPSAIALLRTIIDDGCRFCDSHGLNALDWFTSDFGNVLSAPNKGSKGERVKKIVISEETLTYLRRSFDEDPARPSMAELRPLAGEGRFQELSAIPLFPSALGMPFTYDTYNNDYVRPTMERHEVFIRSKFTAIRATLHRLRAGKIQAELETILRREDIAESRKWALVELLRQDMAIKSKKAFARYCGELIEIMATEGKVERSRMREAQAPNVIELGMIRKGFNGIVTSTDARLAALQ